MKAVKNCSAVFFTAKPELCQANKKNLARKDICVRAARYIFCV